MVSSALAAAPDQRTAPHATANPAVLTLSNVEVLYAEVILALKGVSMQVAEGGCVALLGRQRRRQEHHPQGHLRRH